MTATAAKEDDKWSLSDRKMEGEGGLKTLECLRGRLLAERQASRTAKEDAELMAKKLLELKNQLNEEMKLKDRAEKKLKFLKKKLESLKVSSISDQPEKLSFSKTSEISCTQSNASSSGSNDPKPHEPKSKVTGSEISKESSQNVSEKSHESIRCSSSPEDSKIDDNSYYYSTLKSSMEEIENYENGHLDSIDSGIALVCVTVWLPPVTPALS